MRSILSRLLLAASLVFACAANAQTGLTDLVVARKVNLQGITAPAALTGNVNDYAPAGFQNATTLKLSSTLPVNITGLAGGTSGRVLWIVNAGAFDLTFTPQDVLSAAANRFAIVGPTVVPPGYAVSFIYDPGASRWIGLSQGKAFTVWGQITGSIGNQTDLNDLIATLSRAALTTGLASPDDTVLFSAPNTSTLRIAALQKGIYSTLLGAGLPVQTAIKSFAQQDYPLSSLGLVADGTYARWIGYDSSGTVVTSSQRFTNDSSAIGLGIIVVKRVAGVTTFIDDGGPRSFLTSPQMAQFSTLERAVIGGFKSSVTVTNQSTNMTLARSAGTITGISANWTSLGNKNVLDLAAVATAPFIEINPAIASATSLPAAVTTLTATNYWNGSASVPLTGPNNASVKRFLLGVKGGLFVQEGEFQYTTLDAAVANYATAPFTTLLAQDLFIEIGRLAVQKSASDLSNPTQARFFVTGAGAAGSTGGGGSSVTSVTGTPDEIAVSAPVGAVQVSLPAALTFTGKTVTGGTFASGAFNGTIGATTPSTGQFTTVYAQQDAGGNMITSRHSPGNTRAGVFVMGGQGDAFLGLNLEGAGGNLFNASANGAVGALVTQGGLPFVGMYVRTGLTAGGAAFDFSTLNNRVGFWDGNGYNGPIGATTPSTGAFTTLTATSDFTISGGTLFGTSPIAAFRVGGVARTYIGSASGTDAAIVGAVANDGIWRNQSGKILFSVDDGSTARAIISSTGLAVTGNISSAFNGSSTQGLDIRDSADAANVPFLTFRKASNVIIGSVQRVGTTDAVAYNTTSDGRLKTNVRTFTAQDSGPIIDGLRPVWFDWKSANIPSAQNIIGFIAQDEAAVSPALVRSGAVTPGDADPDKITQQWQRSDSALVPILVAEVKALRSRVASLEGAKADDVRGPLALIGLTVAAFGIGFFFRRSKQKASK